MYTVGIKKLKDKGVWIMIVCTSICNNYLPKAMVLAKTLKQHNPNAKMVVCLAEKKMNEVAKKFKYFDTVVLAKDLGIEKFDQFIFKHSIVEASTAVKGQLFLYLMNKFEREDKFVYLDPDIVVLGAFKELNEALETNEIVLTPQICEHEDNDSIEDIIHNEICCLKYGVFNLGFLAVKRGRESKKFINWWASRLSSFCYDDIPNGLFTDQKWINLAPCIFDIYILKHPGYNVAPWNLSKRIISINKDNAYKVNEQPLRFIHFSGLDSGANEGVIKKYVHDENNPIYSIRHQYIAELEKMGQETIGKLPWSYDYFNTDEKINIQSRIIYRNNQELQEAYDMPFEESNSIFTSIMEQIDEEEWNDCIRNVSKRIKISKDIISRMRFDLCYLRKKFNVQDVNYFIWGASNGGKVTKEIISELFPNFNLVGFIDKYKEGDLQGKKIYSPLDFEQKYFDYIFISTSPGKTEVEQTLNTKGFSMYKDYLKGYGVI